MKDQNQTTETHRASLEGWLTIASRGLCQESRQRIREEVTDHFEEAVEEALSQGVPIEDAENQALTSLGDARNANRGYRCRHLTAWQKLNIDEFVRLRGSWMLLALVLLIPIFLAWQDYFSRELREGCNSLL